MTNANKSSPAMGANQPLLLRGFFAFFAFGSACTDQAASPASSLGRDPHMLPQAATSLALSSIDYRSFLRRAGFPVRNPFQHIC